MTVETERRAKKKTVLLAKRRRDYRVRIQNAGKRVKLTLRSGAAAGWRISGGIQVNYSMDEA